MPFLPLFYNNSEPQVNFCLMRKDAIRTVKITQPTRWTHKWAGDKGIKKGGRIKELIKTREKDPKSQGIVDYRHKFCFIILTRTSPSSVTYLFIVILYSILCFLFSSIGNFYINLCDFLQNKLQYFKSMWKKLPTSLQVLYHMSTVSNKGIWWMYK